ncbi:hypothetical protein C7401_102289 [Paraburkholderia unamae]|uniref:hypothetical protein n=1 Tax=Paraburkholderia unamae TaxID=219649 RepID=UPI000DC43419|nr:hypothetical protein [Paraburkholderia unamae]RAR66864.1 hypothetical protein C7401_102289 [Paraburkholderia unamae]
MTNAYQNEPWYEPFSQGFAAWFGGSSTPPRDHAVAVPLLAKAANMGHGGSALLLDHIFSDLAADASRADAHTLARLALAYRIAVFWTNDGAYVEPDHEGADDWSRARSTAYEPRLWTAMGALQNDPLAAITMFEGLDDNPAQAFFLAALAAEEAADRSRNVAEVDRLLQCARTNFIRSAAAGNRAASKRLFAQA